jgi:hypothetical protein
MFDDVSYVKNISKEYVYSTLHFLNKAAYLVLGKLLCIRFYISLYKFTLMFRHLFGGVRIG